MADELNVPTREREIINFLKEAPSGASSREIYEVVHESLKDRVSRQAYYKILDRMVARGKIEQVREDPVKGKIFHVTPTLHAGNPITLDDVYEMLPFVRTTEVLAAAVNARLYFEEKRKTTLRAAAEKLLERDPVDIFAGLIMSLAKTVNADLEILRHRGADGNRELADRGEYQRFQEDWNILDQVAYRGLSLPSSAINIPAINKLVVSPRTGGGGMRESAETVTYDEASLRAALSGRVFGETFIEAINLGELRADPGRLTLTLSGSDGSMHAGTLAIETGRSYVEDVSDLITFNNSIGVIRPSQMARKAGTYDREELVHSIPFKREVIDDPTYKGLVLAEFMFPDLSDAEYEHMARCATDVVQFRIDQDVYEGSARDLRNGQTLPKPQVHLRDGTVTPQERYFSHYNRLDPYGEMVREGIRLERRILDRIIASGSRGPVFGGAVKSTQMRIFGRALNWYIEQGSKEDCGGAPIDPDWDRTRAHAITDNAAMTALLAALEPEGDITYVTCAVGRSFRSLNELYRTKLGEGETWLDWFKEKQWESMEENLRRDTPLGYHATIDLDDDDFVVMCERAAYVSFYIGHTTNKADPPPLVPRYEFLTTLEMLDESSDDPTAALDVRRRIVNAVDAMDLAIDTDHNFLSAKTFRKLIPYLIYRAHELGKSLGKGLERQLQSVVIARLAEQRRTYLSPSEVTIKPASGKLFIERFSRARRKLKQAEAQLSLPLDLGEATTDTDMDR